MTFSIKETGWRIKQARSLAVYYDKVSEWLNTINRWQLVSKKRQFNKLMR